MTAAETVTANPISVEMHRRPDAAKTPALSIEGINHCYGPRQALIDVSFTVAPCFSRSVRIRCATSRVNSASV